MGDLEERVRVRVSCRDGSHAVTIIQHIPDPMRSFRRSEKLYVSQILHFFSTIIMQASKESQASFIDPSHWSKTLNIGRTVPAE